MAKNFQTYLIYKNVFNIIYIDNIIGPEKIKTNNGLVLFIGSSG